MNRKPMRVQRIPRLHIEGTSGPINNEKQYQPINRNEFEMGRMVKDRSFVVGICTMMMGTLTHGIVDFKRIYCGCSR